jgi:hypothetical protein
MTDFSKAQAEKNIFKSYWAIFLITLFVVSVRLLKAPEEFADFNGYIYLLDYMIVSKISVWEFGDPLSWGILSLLRSYSGDSYSSVVLGNYYLSLIYVAFTLYAIKTYNISWQAVVMIFATFGPILAFVTIRATPAYFIVLFAALEANKGNIRAIPLCLLAALFHSSALLALLPLIASLAQIKVPMVDRAFRAKATAIIIGLLIVAPLILFRNNMIELTRFALDSLGGAFSRFAIYIKDGQTIAAADAGGSTFQQIYFSLSSLALLLFIFFGGKFVGSLQGYLITSYGIFVFMFSDPPSAFRQSLFWMIPLMVVFPWQKFSLRGLGTSFIVPIAIILFWFGFSEVLI